MSITLTFGGTLNEASSVVRRSPPRCTIPSTSSDVREISLVSFLSSVKGNSHKISNQFIHGQLYPIQLTIRFGEKVLELDAEEEGLQYEGDDDGHDDHGEDVE